MAETQKYIFLNNIKLPIVSMVSLKKVTPFPNQLMTGPPEVQDYTPTSKQVWGQLKGGMGIDKWSVETNDRYSEADGVDASLNMPSLAPLVTTMGAFGADPVKIIKYNGRIWAIGHNKISYWTGTAWTAVKTNFPSPTDTLIYYGVS